MGVCVSVVCGMAVARNATAATDCAYVCICVCTRSHTYARDIFIYFPFRSCGDVDECVCGQCATYSVCARTSVREATEPFRIGPTASGYVLVFESACVYVYVYVREGEVER